MNDLAAPATGGRDRPELVLVTGAGGGLGRAVARNVAARGYCVALLGRRVPPLEAVYDEIVAGGGPEPAIVPLDLAKAGAKEFEQLVRLLDGELGGRLRGIVHCAAHFKNFQPLAQLQPFDWIDPLQVNLIAPWGLTRACFPLLEATSGAAVLFLTCPAGHEAKGFQAGYGVSKAALEGLARIWGAEQRKVRIELFDPGPMNTALRRIGYPGELACEMPHPDSVAPRLVELLLRQG